VKQKAAFTVCEWPDIRGFGGIAGYAIRQCNI
jgi:hypothetical protein